MVLFLISPSLNSSLGCKEGIGKGKFLKYGAGGGAGHGGKGGSGFYNGLLIDGGRKYGDADLPCELGSGSSGSSESLVFVAGGGMIGILYLLHYFLVLCSVVSVLVQYHCQRLPCQLTLVDTFFKHSCKNY